MLTYKKESVFDTSVTVIIGRFVLGINSLEAGRRWPDLEPL